MHCRMFSNIPVLYPLDVSSNPLVVTTKNTSNQMSSAGQNLPRLRTTELVKCPTRAGGVRAKGTQVNTADVTGKGSQSPQARLTLGYS